MCGLCPLLFTEGRLSGLYMNEMMKHARIKKGYSKKKLADLVGVSRITIHNIENKGSIPKIDTAIKISKVLDLQLKYLYGENAYDRYFSNI